MTGSRDTPLQARLTDDDAGNSARDKQFCDIGGLW